ncbi:MAG: class I SAM-dependent methyltransferase [Clostridia bacterium]|nr:class I SAM-dependent methyltransferase [Clostridia bacterium]
MNHYDDPAFFAAYAQMSRSREGLSGAGEWHQLQPLFPDVAGKTVLDLGCGYGWHCGYAASMGAASVTGIDQSSLMITEAMKRNASPCISYRVCSLQDYDYPPEVYDLVISNLVLHYVNDLADVYRRIHRTLRPGGVFLMNIEHPTFTAGVNQQFAADGTWPVDRYYEPGERTTDFVGHAITKYHHTLTQILMGLISAGFALKAVEEAMPPEEWRSMMPDEMRRPMMLLVKAEKQ